MNKFKVGSKVKATEFSCKNWPKSLTRDKIYTVIKHIQSDNIIFIQDDSNKERGYHISHMIPVKRRRIIPLP